MSLPFLVPLILGISSLTFLLRFNINIMSLCYIFLLLLLLKVIEWWCFIYLVQFIVCDSVAPDFVVTRQMAQSKTYILHSLRAILNHFSEQVDNLYISERVWHHDWHSYECFDLIKNMTTAKIHDATNSDLVSALLWIV